MTTSTGILEPLAKGKKAPAFTLTDRHGRKHRLTTILKEHTHVVVFFYPKDNTPGCTLEAKGFSLLQKKFEKVDALVIGISGGDDSTKNTFCKKHSINTLLLSDTDFAISKKYGVFGPKQFMGRTFEGIHRTTYVLNAKQKVIKTYLKVKPPQHPKEVLTFLHTL